jgi:hypothetical protein
MPDACDWSAVYCCSGISFQHFAAVRRGIADANDCARQLGPLSGFVLSEFIMPDLSRRFSNREWGDGAAGWGPNDRIRPGAARAYLGPVAPKPTVRSNPRRNAHERATKGRDELDTPKPRSLCNSCITMPGKLHKNADSPRRTKAPLSLHDNALRNIRELPGTPATVPFNPLVTGSNPVRPTKEFKGL